MIFIDVPAFDSSDRLYGSYEKMIVYQNADGKNFSAVLFYGGYRTASVTMYENVCPASSKTKYFLDVLGISADKKEVSVT